MTTGALGGAVFAAQMTPAAAKGPPTTLPPGPTGILSWLLREGARTLDSTEPEIFAERLVLTLAGRDQETQGRAAV